jgi:hypothetical protein
MAYSRGGEMKEKGWKRKGRGRKGKKGEGKGWEGTFGPPHF